jgi:hypothetical protein
MTKILEHTKTAGARRTTSKSDRLSIEQRASAGLADSVVRAGLMLNMANPSSIYLRVE